MDNKDDLIREFKLAQNGCDSYFDYMYKGIQFSFAAIIAILVAATQLFDDSIPNIVYVRAILLSYILPIITYIFGVMYAYNAYALTMCGKRAEEIHQKIFDTDEYSETDLIKDYIVTDRHITLISYGLQLMFYLAFPLSSNVFSLILCDTEKYFFFFKILPFIFTALYLLIMFIIIIAIGKNFFIENINNKKIINLKGKSKKSNKKELLKINTANNTKNEITDQQTGIDQKPT